MRKHHFLFYPMIGVMIMGGGMALWEDIFPERPPKAQVSTIVPGDFDLCMAYYSWKLAYAEKSGTGIVVPKMENFCHKVVTP